MKRKQEGSRAQHTDRTRCSFSAQSNRVMMRAFASLKARVADAAQAKPDIPDCPVAAAHRMAHLQATEACRPWYLRFAPLCQRTQPARARSHKRPRPRSSCWFGIPWQKSKGLDWLKCVVSAMPLPKIRSRRSGHRRKPRRGMDQTSKYAHSRLVLPLSQRTHLPLPGLFRERECDAIGRGNPIHHAEPP